MHYPQDLPSINGVDWDDYPSGVFNFLSRLDDALITSKAIDVVFSRGGNDIIATLGGNDLVLAGAGTDVALLGNGDDIALGGSGRDFLFGGPGNDTLFGQGGDDFLRGGAGNDMLRGGNGDDRLIGNTGIDTLLGGRGNDLLDGGMADDKLSGGDGRDTLIGNKGDDRLRGGDDADIFVFDPSRPMEGNDLILDFTLGEDLIELNVSNVLAATPGLAAAIIAGGGTVDAVLGALDDAPEWSLSSTHRGDAVISHPNGSITLRDIPAEGLTGFADLADALAVDGLGSVLIDLAAEAGNPPSVAALVGATSDGVPDNDNQNFDLLLTALQATGLDSVLADNGGAFSVLAPNDAAFISLAQRLGFAGNDEEGALTAILDALGGLNPDGNPVPLLTDVLLYHVIDGAQTLGELRAAGDVQPLFEDADLAFGGNTIGDADPDFSDPTIIDADLITGNGTVQVLSEVLLPFDL